MTRLPLRAAQIIMYLYLAMAAASWMANAALWLQREQEWMPMDHNESEYPVDNATVEWILRQPEQSEQPAQP